MPKMPPWLSLTSETSKILTQGDDIDGNGEPRLPTIIRDKQFNLNQYDNQREAVKNKPFFIIIRDK